MNKKNIAVIGLGGVGGYFGFKINQANKQNQQYRVSFVARGKTYDRVKENGLTLLSPEHTMSITRPGAIFENISDLSKPDLIFVCVKEYDLENVCRQLFSIIGENTIILPLMNGADIYDRIRTIIPHHTILPSCVYVASHIKEKGVVEHKGKTGRLIFGKDPNNLTEDLDWIVDLLKNSKINVEFKENSLIEIWVKFMFIASFGLVTSKYNSSIGAVCSIELQRGEATRIMAEIMEIAKRKGIDLPNHIIERTFEKAATFPPLTPTSLQLDIQSGKKGNELELFAGAILRYGKETGIDTSFTKSTYLEVKSILQKLQK